MPNPPAKVVKVDFDGHPIPLIDDLHWKLTLPPGSDVTSMAAKFKIVIPTTCGDEGVEVTAVGADGQVTGKWPASAMVYVDRDSVGSAATVSVGGVVVEGTSMKVLAGACPTGREIRVDDTIVGQLGVSTIVDAKGGHCYEVMTSGFPAARLEGKRTYERPLDLFLPAEIPVDKNAVRHCEGGGGHGSGSLTELLGGSTKPLPPNTPVGAFTANPLSKGNKPPTPKPPPKPPRKPKK